MEKPSDWYVFKDVDKLDSPALVIYPERVKFNIALLIKMAGNPARLRPHIKTHKCKEAIVLQLAAGITKFKCATIAEAELLGICKAPDVLLAYQPVGEKIKRFIALTERYPGTLFSCLVDNKGTGEELSVAALAVKMQIPVYIDVNVGMDRTGVIPDETVELYTKLNLLKGIKPVGLHAYDGHIHDGDLQIRNFKAQIIYDQLLQLRSEIVDLGLTEPIIVAGGTPTFPFYADKQDVICSPGTFIYWDAGYSENFKEQEFQPAALIVTRVVSLPTNTKVCLDLGHKAVAAESELGKRIRFLNAPDMGITGQSEEHLVTDTGAEHYYKPGDIIFAVPYHICPTVALYDKAVTVEDGKITGEWLTLARSRKMTI